MCSFFSNLCVFLLFTDVPIVETTEYILEKIYGHDKLPKLCSRPIFKILPLKLTIDNTSIQNSISILMDAPWVTLDK